MTEYELATLASRELGHLIALAQVLAAVAIGCGQIAVVWFGIRVMRIAGDRRAAEQDQRHAEAIQRQDQHHAENIRALDAQSRALDTQSRALETLIARTAPPE